MQLSPLCQEFFLTINIKKGKENETKKQPFNSKIEHHTDMTTMKI